MPRIDVVADLVGLRGQDKDRCPARPLIEMMTMTSRLSASSQGRTRVPPTKISDVRVQMFSVSESRLIVSPILSQADAVT